MLRNHRPAPALQNPEGDFPERPAPQPHASAQSQKATGASPLLLEWDHVERVAIPPPGSHCARLFHDAAAGEQFRLIRTRVVHHVMQPQTILVSSAGMGDGKTTTAVNLAWVIALRERARTLLIDGDLRRPSLRHTFGIRQRSGLADLLRANSTLTQAIVNCGDNPKLYVLTAGINCDGPAELLDTAVYQNLTEALRKLFDFIIIDAPPVGAVADYELLEGSADGVILVVRPDHTDRVPFLAALDRVQPERLLGVVVNCARDWPFWKAPSSYSYYY